MVNLSHEFRDVDFFASKDVVKSGNSGAVIIPRRFVGRRVYIIICGD